jgi:hypothetical protein
MQTNNLLGVTKI